MRRGRNNYRYYSIHNILKVKTNIEVSIPDYFLIKERGIEGDFNPDIEIIRENFDVIRPKEGVAKSRNYFYWTERSALIIDYAAPFMNTKLIIDDLGGKTKIKFTESLSRFGRIDPPSINSILDIKLTLKDFALLHGGCLNYNGRCLLFIASRDIGKTSTVLSLLDEEKIKFMSDDLTIISRRGEAYAYPEKVSISPYTLTGKVLPPYSRIIRSRLAKSHFLSLLLGRFFNLELVERREVPRNLIEDKGKISKVFILKGGVKDERIEQIDHADVVRKIISATLGLINPTKEYLLNFYSYILDFSLYDLLAEKKKIIEEAIKNAECFEVRSNNVGRYSEMIREVI